MPTAIAAAVVTTLGVTGTAATVTTFVVTAAAHAAIATAANMAARAVAGKGKAAMQERQASVVAMSLGEVPREAVIGLTRVGGSLVDVWNHGGQYGTDKVTRCIALADHACEGLYGYIVDDVFYPYAGPGVQPGFGGKLSIDFRNATADGHAPPADAIAAGWEATDRMTAVTHAWVTTEFDEKVWTQGHPKFSFVIHGLCCFDPRQGDDWADRSTHSFTRNPMLQRYALARGIYAEGRQGQAEHLLIGRGLTEAQAPLDRLIANANLCEEYVGDLFRYYCDGVISAAMDFIAVEQLFADAVAGSIIQPEGGVEVEPGQAKAAVVSITDGDLAVGEPVGFNRFLADKDGGRINTVVPRYIEPAQNWVDHSGPVRRDLADIATDGGPREMTLSMPLVSGAAVADRNAEIARRLARLERRATIVLPPEFFWLEAGDWIAWTSARRHKGATVRYRIESWTLDEQWRMRLSLREIASSVYGVPDPIEDAAETPPPPPVIDALSLPGAAVQAITLPGETSILPALRATWDTPVDAAVRAIRLEVRTAGDTDASPTRFEGDQLAQGVGIGTNGVAADQVLQARLVPVGDPSRPVLPSVWFPVNTAPVTAGDAASWGGMPPSRLAELQATLSGTIGQLLTLANDRAAGALAEQRDRLTQIHDTLDRLTLVAAIDPIARTAIVRGDVMLEGEAETIAQTFVQVRAAAAALAAVVALEQSARVAGDEAEAYARLQGLAQAAGALAAADLAIRAWTDGRISAATAGLATSAAVAAAISASSLELQSWTNGRIATATAGLATTAAVAAAIAASALTLRGEVTAEIATAVADLVSTAALASAIASSALTLRGEVTAEIALAIANLATTAAVAAAIAASALTLRSEVTAEIATAVADLVSTAALASAIASSALTLRGDVTAEIAVAIADLVTTATLAASIAAATLTLRSEVTAEIALAVAGLATTAAVAASVAATDLNLRSWANGQIATATAGLTTAAQLATAIAGALIQSQLQVDAYAASAALTFAGQAAFNGLTSTVGVQGTAISGLQSINNIARLELIAAAGGGVPARIGITSAAGSSDIAFEASRIWWGPNTVFHAATGQLRTTYGSGSRRVIALGAAFGSDALWMWTGPASVAFGSETFANATGGAESDVRQYFGGEILHVPFGSDAPTGSSTALTGAFQTIATGIKAVRNGVFWFEAFAELYADGTPDAEGFRAWSVDFQIVSVNLDASEFEVLWSDSTGGSWGPGAPVEWLNYLGRINLGDPRPGSKSGRRSIVLQARVSSAATTASVRNGGYRAIYAP